jgi:HEAT repeat protein
LADPDARVRRRAAELAASFPGDHPPTLFAALADAASAVVEAAAGASGERVPPEPSIVDRLAELATSHDDALCREAAVAALGSLQSQVAHGEPASSDSPDEQAGLQAVLAATKDRPAVRRRAVLALAAFSGPEVEEALERARHDRDWQVRQAVSDVAPEAGRPGA